MSRVACSKGHGSPTTKNYSFTRYVKLTREHARRLERHACELVGDGAYPPVLVDDVELVGEVWDTGGTIGIMLRAKIVLCTGGRAADLAAL